MSCRHTIRISRGKDLQVVLYFKTPQYLADAEKLRIEIIGDPRTVEKIKKLIRNEVASWKGWEEC